jgi:hypothetical protein
MGETFIALENPESWLGYKDGNLPAKPKPELVLKGSRAERREQERVFEREMRELAHAVEEKYGPRRTFVESTFGSLDNTATTLDRQAVLEGTSKRASMHVASTGSLPSMMKRLAAFATEGRGRRFDTLVFVGHGDEGDMSVGIGHLPEARTARGKEFAQGIRADTRVMTVKNPDTWAAEFLRVNQYLEVDPSSGRLHVFLVGCATALHANGIGGVTTLPRLMANRLATDLNMSMAVYGTTQEITPKETRKIIDELDTIKANCVPGTPYQLKGTAMLKCKHA